MSFMLSIYHHHNRNIISKARRSFKVCSAFPHKEAAGSLAIYYTEKERGL